MGNKFCLFVFFILTILISCQSNRKLIKNTPCNDNIIVQYDKVKKGDEEKPKADKNLKSFSVYFLSSYKDSIQGIVNGKKVFEKYLDIDGNSHNMSNYFYYDYSKDNGNSILKINSVKDKSCFEIEVDKKYKLIYVFKEDTKWMVRFSNIYYIN